jgi:Spy/CpxP family protein refolding chaperone
MNGFRSAILGFVLLAALGASAFAQPPQRRGGPGARDDAFRMVDAYIVSNLQESVGLTDEQFVKILPLVTRLQSERREAGERRREGLREMRRLLQSGTATEGRVLERLREVKAIEVEEVDSLRRNLESIDAVLTPIQQAKFRVMQIEVEQKIRELMQEARERRRGERQDP